VGLWTSCPGHAPYRLHCSVAAAAGRDCNRPTDSPPPPLTAAAAESRLTPRSVYFFSQSQLGRLLLRVPGRSVLFPSPHASLQHTHQPPLLLLISQRDSLEVGVDYASDTQLVVSKQRMALY